MCLSATLCNVGLSVQRAYCSQAAGGLSHVLQLFMTPSTEKIGRCLSECPSAELLSVAFVDSSRRTKHSRTRDDVTLVQL